MRLTLPRVDRGPLARVLRAAPRQL